jgi:pimeloyl-ACP methyl ester carboxylesterase
MHELQHRTVSTNGIEMHVAEQGEGPVVVLCHGFPELWYSWRHQMGALSDAGYRVLAPDQRGYGGTSQPTSIDAYDVIQLTDDLLGMLDALGIDEAVFIGHDFGAPVVWTLSLLAPQRVRAVAALSVPFTPRSSSDPITIFESIFKDHFFYILHFQTPGVADAEFNADPEDALRRMMRETRSASAPSVIRPASTKGMGFLEQLPAPGALPSWLTQEDLDYYVGEFTRTGFTGGLNWYRNLRRNWELTPQLAGATVSVPAFFLTGDKDPVRLFMPGDSMAEWVPDLRGNVCLADAGHWVQQERPDEVNAALLGFLASLD